MTRTPQADLLAIEELAEDEKATLREQAKGDPWRGFDMVAEHQGDKLRIPPGMWRGNAMLDLPPFLDSFGDLPANCPVTPLGMDGKHCYFLSPMGHVKTLGDTNAGKTPIIFLFGGRTRYLEWAWPRFGKAEKDRDAPVTGWAVEDCLPDLVNACAYRGTFSLEDQVRGRGAWRHVDGSLIYHAGDKVWFEGRWQNPGQLGDHIYPGRPKLAKPAARYEPEGEGSPGDALLKVLETFNWERKRLDPRLALGWLMTAKIGGALQRRPVGFVVGEEGSGKTTLQDLLRLAMGGALLATSNTTQAGIYQRVQQDSVAVMVDEMEAKEDTRTTDKIIELARIAYSGDKMQRGGKDGDAKEFALMSSFLGSSIAKPATGAQDDSRMAVMMMRPLQIDAAKSAKQIDARTIAEWAADTFSDSPINGSDVEKWGAQLLRRAFEWWPRWPSLLRVFRQALMTAGHDNRSADTFGALAAGCHMALRDDLPTADDLAFWLNELKADGLAETSTKEKTWRRCFMVLLKTPAEAFRTLSPNCIEDVLLTWKSGGSDATFDAGKKLANFGMSLSFAKGHPEDWEHARLFVPANHPGLHALLAGTPWGGHLGNVGPWIGVLRQMPPELFENGKCDKGLDKKASGIFIRLAAALEA